MWGDKVGKLGLTQAWLCRPRYGSSVSGGSGEGAVLELEDGRMEQEET